MLLKGLRSQIAFLCWAIVCLILIPPAEAQTKRALLIGIDTYEAKGKAISKPAGVAQRNDAANASRWDLLEWGNLDGSLNDVESVHELLASPKFAFAENNIHIVEEEKATREGILHAMKKYLLDEPNRGDTVVFYYAGHGSQRFNSLTDKPFHLDETLVPSDASSGAFDIRDKEIARLFNQIVDKGILLTAIFDSCHSGSIARGIPVGSQGKARFLAYDTRDAKDPPDRGPDGKPTARPEDRPGGSAGLVRDSARPVSNGVDWKRWKASRRFHGGLSGRAANSPREFFRARYLQASESVAAWYGRGATTGLGRDCGARPRADVQQFDRLRTGHRSGPPGRLEQRWHS
jgi:hypothetical protein